MFVLCGHCTRMILIRSTLSTGIVELRIWPFLQFALVTTTSRKCKSQYSRPTITNTLSQAMVEKSRVYDCACKVADAKKVTLLDGGGGSVMAVSVEDIADKLSTGCQVCGVCTNDTTLKKLDELNQESLILPYLPGAFL